MTGPNPLDIDFAKNADTKWAYSEQIEATTGAPQKLYRHLIDAIQRRGYYIISGVEPDIKPTAIEKTGTTQGWIIAERLLKEIPSEGGIIEILGQITGLAVLLYGAYLGFSSLFSDSSGGLFGGFVIMTIGGLLMGYCKDRYDIGMRPKFASNLVYATLTGEVYYSALGADVSEGTSSAESRRASLVSELRLTVNMTTIMSWNVGDSRYLFYNSRDPSAEADLRGIVSDIRADILPKAVLQKSVEHAELSRAPYLPPRAPQAQPREPSTKPACPKCGKQVSPEFAICPFCGQVLKAPVQQACTNCGALNPSTAKSCFNCGAELQKS